MTENILHLQVVANILHVCGSFRVNSLGGLSHTLEIPKQNFEILEVSWDMPEYKCKPLAATPFDFCVLIFSFWLTLVGQLWQQ